MRTRKTPEPIVVGVERFDTLGEFIAAYEHLLSHAGKLDLIIKDAREARAIPADPGCELCGGSRLKVVSVRCCSGANCCCGGMPVTQEADCDCLTPPAPTLGRLIPFRSPAAAEPDDALDPFPF